jgi:ATP-dependent helicase/DNAse subunit B
MLKVNGYEVPEHASYSSITTWLACGYQYYLSRIQKVAEQPAVWFIGGSAVHRATEQYDLELWNKENER